MVLGNHPISVGLPSPGFTIARRSLECYSPLKLSMALDTLLGIAGVVLGTLGLAAAYIFYRKSIRAKEPMYAMRSENLIRDNISRMTGLKILYNDINIVNLTTTNIAFWNRGAETIDSRDRVESNPLRIGASQEVKILDAKIILENNPSSRMHISLEADGSSAYVFFDYLDKGHGGIIQVIHTGLSSSDLSLIGDIKGARLEKVKPKNVFLYVQVLYLSVATALIWMASPMQTRPLPAGIVTILAAAVYGIILIERTEARPIRRFSSPLPKSFHQIWYSSV